MKLNLKLLGAVVVAGGVIGAAYYFGRSSSNAVSATESATTAVAAPASAPHPAAADQMMNVAATSNDVRFSHFRVGNRNVKSMFADGKYIWIGTSGGVVRYDTEADDYKMFNNQNSGLLSNGIFHISKVFGRIAVGTYGGGLSLYDPSKDSWENINIPQGLADQFVYDLIVTKKGDVWIATWSGANRVKGGNFSNPTAWETFTMENTKGGLPNPWVYGVEEGQNGEIWFATENGLARYKEGQWQNWQHKDGLGADLELVKDAIQFKSDPGKASMHHARQKDEQGLHNVNVAYNPNYVISMVVQADGTVWCGTWGGGLARFDGKNWRNYTTADGLPANHIFMLSQDAKGQLWAGTNQGMARLKVDGKTFEVKTVADGLFADNVFSMANAPDGSVWVGSFGGVAHIENGWVK